MDHSDEVTIFHYFMTENALIFLFLCFRISDISHRQGFLNKFIAKRKPILICYRITKLPLQLHKHILPVSVSLNTIKISLLLNFSQFRRLLLSFRNDKIELIVFLLKLATGNLFEMLGFNFSPASKSQGQVTEACG